MTTTWGVAVVLAAIAGTGLGWLLRGWADRNGHTLRMRRPRLSRTAFSTYTRPLGVGLVVIALLSNALLGFLLIDQRRSNADLTACVARYNELDGKARDERAQKSGLSTDAALTFAVALRDGIRSGSLSRGGLLATLNAYAKALTASKNAQLANPYPPPDYCSPGGEGRRK